MLDIVTNYRRIKFQGKLMIQTWKNGEKPHFGPYLDPLGSNWDHLNSFYKTSS